MADTENTKLIRLIGLRIKALRNKKGLTQEHLAETVGITPQYLGNIERGKENPTLKTFINLSNGLNTDIGELFYLLKAEDKKQVKKIIQEKIKTATDDELMLLSKIFSALL